MERGRKNKSPFKIFSGVTGALGGMNRGRGGNRGRGRVTREPNIMNPGRPLTPADFQQPEVDMEAVRERLAAYKAEKQAELTQTNPRPQPQNLQQFGQVGMMGAGGSGNSMYDRALAVRENAINRVGRAKRAGMFGGQMRQPQMGRAMEHFNSITGRNNFPLTLSQAANSFLTFKRKPSGFKMKKK